MARDRYLISIALIEHRVGGIDDALREGGAVNSSLIEIFNGVEKFFRYIEYDVYFYNVTISNNLFY